MTGSGSPLLFRASMAQRAMAFFIFAGSWLAGVRAISYIVKTLPGLHFALQVARAADEPAAKLWALFILSFAAALLTGALLLGSLLFALLVPADQTKTHLHTLSLVAKRLADKTICRRLRSAQSDEELYQIITEAEGNQDDA